MRTCDAIYSLLIKVSYKDQWGKDKGKEHIEWVGELGHGSGGLIPRREETQRHHCNLTLTPATRPPPPES